MVVNKKGSNIKMNIDRFQEAVFFSTVRITIPSKSGSGASIGTGFLFRAPLNDTNNRSVTLLISTRHVFGSPTNPIVLNFHKSKPDGSGPELGQVVTLQDNQFDGIYQAHPSPNVDLACINVSVITQPQHNIFRKTIYPDMISDFSEDDLIPGANIWFVGYPENRFDTAHNLPILRRGYIASIPTVDFNSEKQFLIDAQVFPGSSGSPVFTTLGGKFKFLGVVTESMIRSGKLQAVPTGTNLGVQQFLGLGIVIKAFLIKELIDHVTEQVRLALEKEEREPTTEEPTDNPQNGVFGKGVIHKHSSVL